MERRIVWIDVEATGLDATSSRTLLLEVGLSITDTDLRELGRESVVVSHSIDDLGNASWGETVYDMHTENGLLAACLGPAALTMLEAESLLLGMLARYAGVNIHAPAHDPGNGSADPAAPIWGGCSTSIDRALLRRDMPRFYERIHYRTMDATSLRLALDLWADVVTHRAHQPHRALDDAVAASKLANLMRKRLLRTKARAAC